MLMQQRMYASIRKTVKIFYLEFLFSNLVAKTTLKLKLLYIILISMFNSNPMIPQYLKLVEYSKIFTIILVPPQLLLVS